MNTTSGPIFNWKNYHKITKVESRKKSKKFNIRTHIGEEWHNELLLWLSLRGADTRTPLSARVKVSFKNLESLTTHLPSQLSQNK